MSDYKRKKITRDWNRVEYDIPSTSRTTGYAPIYFTYFRDTFGIAITVSSRREVETIYCTAARQNLLLQRVTIIASRAHVYPTDRLYAGIITLPASKFTAFRNCHKINQLSLSKYSKMHRLISENNCRIMQKFV